MLLLIAASIAKDGRLCMCCAAASLGDEKHLVFECAALAELRVKYADSFSDHLAHHAFRFCTK